MTIGEALGHVGSNYNSAYVRQRVLEAIPHYIWTQGSAKKRRGFCTACRQWSEQIKELPDWVVDDPYAEDYAAEFDGSDRQIQTLDTSEYGEKVTGKTGHLQYGWCPICGARGQFRSLNMGRKHMHDHIFLIMYGKSELEAGAIVCVGYAADVYWNELNTAKITEIPVKIEPTEVCVFRDGKGGQRFIKEPEYFSGKENQWICRWIRKRECKSSYAPSAGYFGIGLSYRRSVILDVSSFEEALAGTRVGKLIPGIQDCETYSWYDKIGILDVLMRRPCIEYFVRLGLFDLANDAIDKKCGHILNYKGKTAKAVLRLTDEQWSEVKGKKLNFGIDALVWKDWFPKHGMTVNMETCDWMGHFSTYDIERLITTARKEKQEPLKMLLYCQRKNARIGDYLDYIRQLEELRMEKNKKNLYPKKFDVMHERLTSRISYVKNKKYDEAIQLRVKELGEYCFSTAGLVIRPMNSSKEIVDEGTALCHCVGSYAGRYSTGDIVLCALRDEAAPETPLYTVEFSKSGQMIQCRGYRNNTKEEDKERLAEFWRLFEETRAERKKQLAREKKTKPNEKKARNAA